MISIQRILCPVDGSEFSERALRYAVTLASWYEAQTTALWVGFGAVPTGAWVGPPVGLTEPGPDERTIRAFVERVAAGASVEIVTTEGMVVPQILRVAGELPADLIVMGTHGAGGFERLVLGSVTEKVLRKAPCPVLTVPRLATPDVTTTVVFRTIVCGIDFSPASRRALNYALALAQEADGRILVAHSLESLPEHPLRFDAHFDVPEFRRALERETRVELEALIPEEAKAWCEPEVVIGHGKAYRELLRIAGERNADVIVLGVQGRGAVDLALFGSTAAHVVRQATCPVLTVPSQPGERR